MAVGTLVWKNLKEITADKAQTKTADCINVKRLKQRPVPNRNALGMPNSYIFPNIMLLRILAEALERPHRFELWFVSDLLPIFLANIFIDLNYVCIKRIQTILFTP